MGEHHTNLTHLLYCMHVKFQRLILTQLHMNCQGELHQYLQAITEYIALISALSFDIAVTLQAG